MKNLYVVFDDSNTDPTYSPADGVSLVLSKETEDDFSGPMAPYREPEAVPLVPRTAEELLTFARFMGWCVGEDNEGQLVIYTGISESGRETL